MDMKTKDFTLTTGELAEIGVDFCEKIKTGLKEDGQEIACLPTYIYSKKKFEGNVLALDWGGTNFRASIVKLSGNSAPQVLEELKKTLSSKETQGFTESDLHREMADLIAQLKSLDKSVTQIGYCFSYPAESTISGDAILLRWTKGINIPDMLNKLVGKPLLECLNNYPGIKEKTQFQSIKVINDTIACLFAGLAQPGYDTYMGLIVGTGTNMATLIDKNNIQKLSPSYNGENLVPVNLESGNLMPNPGFNLIDGKYMTEVDKAVDKQSNNQGQQLFEKAISGGYLGGLFKNTFSGIEIEPKFDGEKLTNIMNYPAIYKEEYMEGARNIYVRSAQLVAASLAGLILVMVSYDKKDKSYNKGINNICLAADGSLFWSEDKNGSDYHQLVLQYLKTQLEEFGIGHINVHANKLVNPNLIGASIAALS